MIERVLVVLVAGSGDIASAVAHALRTDGHAVAIVETAAPAVSRRGMAFADAVFDGTATLEGIAAVRVDDSHELAGMWSHANVIPLLVNEMEAAIEVALPWAVIDARMRKRARPADIRSQTVRTIGLGPGFAAGINVDVAIETSWERLGEVIESGSTLELSGEPKPIGGRARERYVYAPSAGVVRTAHRIGDLVRGGDEIATIEGRSLVAPFDGALPGLVRDGVLVSERIKVIEIDPRGDPSACFGIGERPATIAAGVLRAIESLDALAR